MSKINKPPISLSRLIRYMAGKVFAYNSLLYLDNHSIDQEITPSQNNTHVLDNLLRFKNKRLQIVFCKYSVNNIPVCINLSNCVTMFGYICFPVKKLKSHIH